MHGRYDAHPHHSHHHHTHSYTEDGSAPTAGHNHPDGSPVQWQTVHEPGEHTHDRDVSNEQRDLDLVEQAFLEGFQTASDPTSFLRLAGIAFDVRREDGRRLTLLRVERQAHTDVGSVTPHLGGESFHYAPLPARMVSRREELRFIYFDGAAVVALSLAEARAMKTNAISD